jgi:hypothetical protein
MIIDSKPAAKTTTFRGKSCTGSSMVSRIVLDSHTKRNGVNQTYNCITHGQAEESGEHRCLPFVFLEATRAIYNCNNFSQIWDIVISKQFRGRRKRERKREEEKT